MSAQATAPVSFVLSIELLEDMHTGSGLGGADIDALVARDRYGQPTVRWSHVRGLLRQALQDRLDALGASDVERDRQLRALFGSAGLGRDDRGAVRGRSWRVQSSKRVQTLVWSSTAREPGSRVPKHDTLRKVEFIPAGTEFIGELRLRVCADDDERVALVEKLLKRLDRVGGDRSRGAGRIRMTFTRPMSGTQVQGNTSGNAAPSAQRSVAPPGNYRLLLQAVDPVCLAATGHPGSLIRGNSHLSPSTVAGMLTRWAIDSGRTGLADALLGQTLRCGPGYPVPAEYCGEETRLDQIDSLPFPLSFQSPKPPPQADALPWWSNGALAPGWTDTLTRRDEDFEKLKRPGPHDYLVCRGNTWERFRCDLRITMRNDTGVSQRGREKQQLYTLEEVEEDTGFVVRIEATDAQAGNELQQALEALQNSKDWLAAGRGGAPMRVLKMQPPTDAKGQSPAERQRTVRVLVESELILRAPDLRFRARLDLDAFKHLLQLAGATADLVGKVRRVNEVSEPAEVRGRNVTTSAPRLRALAIRRGSEALAEFEDQASADQARKLLMDEGRLGLGERSGEGHGRVRIGFAPVCPNGEQSASSVLTKKAAATSPETNAEETVLAEALALIGEREAIPFSAGRWQSLRAAARQGSGAALHAWVKAAERQVKTMKEKEAGVAGALLKSIKHRVKQLGNANEDISKADRQLLRTVGWILGKRAAHQRKESR